MGNGVIYVLQEAAFDDKQKCFTIQLVLCEFLVCKGSIRRGAGSRSNYNIFHYKMVNDTTCSCFVQKQVLARHTGTIMNIYVLNARYCVTHTHTPLTRHNKDTNNNKLGTHIECALNGEYRRYYINFLHNNITYRKVIWYHKKSVSTRNACLNEHSVVDQLQCDLLLRGE